MSSDFFRGLFNTPQTQGLGGVPFYRPTNVPGMPLQDVLLNKFANREGVFSPLFGAPKQKAGVSPYAAPLYSKALNDGGLIWSYDKNWMKSIRPPVPQAERSPLAEIFNAHPGKYTGGGEKEYNPATDPWPGPPWMSAPMPPDRPGGHWEIVGTNQGGDGQWHWVKDDGDTKPEGPPEK